jgi:hypothetical protein
MDSSFQEAEVWCSFDGKMGKNEVRTPDRAKLVNTLFAARLLLFFMRSDSVIPPR